MTMKTALLKRIDRFTGEAGIAESTFGRLAVNDGKFVPRLRKGGGVTVATVERVEAFIAKRRKAISRRIVR